MNFYINIYYVLFSLLILFGAVLNSELLWNISDIFMGAMTIINVPVIILLGKYAFRAVNDYVRQRKQGKEPSFLAKNVGLNEKLDYWQDEVDE